MKKTEILDYLIVNQDVRGIAHWKLHVEKSGGLESYGVGLSKIRKFSKSIGRDGQNAAIDLTAAGSPLCRIAVSPRMAGETAAARSGHANEVIF